MKNGNISFAPWVSWTSRSSLPGIDRPSVYIIGRFGQPPPSGAANPFDKNVVYIGESSEGRLRGRWRSFELAAFRGTGKHRGGKRYNQAFGGDSSVLYVSILPDKEIVKVFLRFGRCSFIDDVTASIKVTAASELEDLLWDIDDLLVKYVERRLILLYSIVHGNRPACNAK